MVTTPVRVVVQDRRRLLREGMAGILAAEPGIEVVAAVAHAGELPATGGIDAVLTNASDESGSWPDVRLVRFTGDDPAGSLVEALRGTATSRIDDQPARQAAERSGFRLTPREAEVVRRVADGLSTEQVATALGISRKSVDNHKQRIFAKLGAQNGAHAVALEAGFAAPPDGPLKVVVADPSLALRSILARTVGAVADIAVVASVASLSDLLTCCRQCAPKVVLTGASFADGSLVEAIPDVLLAGARVLVVCDAGAAEAVSSLLFAGASGCLFVQDAGPAEVVAATRDVAAGNAALHPAAAAAVLRQWRTARAGTPDSAEGRSGTAPAPPQLTPREAEVLGALARGLPTKTIGRKLAVSPKTIDAHIARLLAKLGVRNRAQAVSVALERGLLASREAGGGA